MNCTLQHKFNVILHVSKLFDPQTNLREGYFGIVRAFELERVMQGSDISVDRSAKLLAAFLYNLQLARFVVSLALHHDRLVLQRHDLRYLSSPLGIQIFVHQYIA
jgi:hypothetical protein